MKILQILSACNKSEVRKMYGQFLDLATESAPVFV